MATHDELLGALKYETLTLKCEVDASPPAESFHWTFNSSGEQTELPARLHSSEVGFAGFGPVDWIAMMLIRVLFGGGCVFFIDRVLALELHADHRSGLRDDFVLGSKRDWRTESAVHFSGRRRRYAFSCIYIHKCIFVAFGCLANSARAMSDLL